MSGVIIDGVQYERCNGCGKFVWIDTLKYEEPSEQYEYGRDLCYWCAKKSKGIVGPNIGLTIYLK
jgi:hypothetical protein